MWVTEKVLESEVQICMAPRNAAPLPSLDPFNVQKLKGRLCALTTLISPYFFSSQDVLYQIEAHRFDSGPFEFILMVDGFVCCRRDQMHGHGCLP